MKTVFRIAFTVVLLSSTGSSLVGQEWTRFRGPNGTGISDAKGIPVKWTDDDLNWKIALPGKGHSSPVVWGDKVFLLSANPATAKRYVLCVDAKSGAIIWTREFQSAPHHLHARSSYASCTPAVDEARVYVGWSTPEKTTLMALDHLGNTKWELDLGTWTSQHGFGASPIVYQDTLILHLSQQSNQLQPGQKPGKSFMLAFNRATGKELWRTPLISANVCYSVPFIYSPKNGADELICTSTGNGVFSLNPKTGKFNWSTHGGTDEPTFSMRTVSSPIFAGGVVFGTTGSGAYAGNYIVAVRPGKKPEIAYSLKNSGKFKAPYVPCLLAKGDDVFLMHDRGFATCLHAPTGKIHWFARTGTAFNASPIRIGDRIYAVDEDGVVWVIAADTKEFRVLAKNPLGEPSSSTPAVSGGRLFLRTFSHLYCIGGGAS